VLATSRCESTLHALAARITANRHGPFGMPGVALFARDAAGQQVAVYAGSDHDGQPLDADRTVCLASVGKMAVALLVLELVDRGRLSFSSRLGDVCSEATGSVADATIGDLLSHRAGVPPIIAETDLAYSDTLTWPDIRRVCLSLDRQESPPRRVRYSDAAYGLLGIVVEAVSGAPLHECLATQLNARLGTRLTLGLPPGPEYVKVPGAPTPFTSSSIEPLNSAFWHGLALPWAGICGAPHDGLALVRAFASSGLLLDDALRQRAVHDPDHGSLAGGIHAREAQLGIDPTPPLEWDRCAWGLGVELRGEKQPHWTPAEASAASFGHVGISGTLAWHDPVADVSWAMVGTRSSHSGWLLRYGPMLGRAVLSCVAPTPALRGPDATT
jgi:beta-lactamase class C